MGLNHCEVCFIWTVAMEIVPLLRNLMRVLDSHFLSLKRIWFLVSHGTEVHSRAGKLGDTVCIACAWFLSPWLADSVRTRTQKLVHGEINQARTLSKVLHMS